MLDRGLCGKMRPIFFFDQVLRSMFLAGSRCDKAGAIQADHGVVSRPSLGLLEPACGSILHAAHYVFFFLRRLDLLRTTTFRFFAFLCVFAFALRICIPHT